jgi:hypothetical protein
MFSQRLIPLPAMQGSHITEKCRNISKALAQQYADEFDLALGPFVPRDNSSACAIVPKNGSCTKYAVLIPTTYTRAPHRGHIVLIDD